MHIYLRPWIIVQLAFIDKKAAGEQNACDLGDALMTQVAQQVEVKGKLSPEFQEILTPEALAFVAELHNEFNPTREKLLKHRAVRKKR